MAFLWAFVLVVVDVAYGHRVSLEREPTLPRNGWLLEDDVPVPPTHTMKVLVSFAQRNKVALERLFWEVSTPGTSRYRQFASDEDLRSLVAAPQESVSRVLDWLAVGSPTPPPSIVSIHGDHMWVTLSASAVERAFRVQLAYFRRGSRRIVRSSMPYTVPDGLAPLLHSVQGVSEFFPVPWHNAGHVDSPGDTITPPIIRHQYTVGDTKGSGPHSQGVAMFEDAQFKQEWLATFLKNYSLPVTVIKVDGDNSGGYYGEATLDTEYVTAMGASVPTWWIYQQDFDMLKWSLHVGGMPSPPSVVSISWGSPEHQFTTQHMQAASTEFQKLGLKGISMMCASGDKGTGSTGFGCKKFAPQWPASSPYMTAVGGTYLSSGKETGWVGSGGGFSEVFPQPSYQASAVHTYLTTATLPAATRFNATGRAIPDVSALATNFRTYSGGWGELTGTSAASPTFAGIISLVVSKKGPLGFLNPHLYSLKSIGYDVVDGDNKHAGCPKGFPAIAGWDAVTGLGTPDLTKLEAL